MSPIIHTPDLQPSPPPRSHRKYFFITLAALLILTIGFVGYTYFDSTNRERIRDLALASLGNANEPEGIQYGAWPALSDPDFFASVHKTFVDNEASFIEANLSTMRLTVYTNGKAALEVPIRTKGREGSWWETPSGLYKVGAMAKHGSSSFADVSMPWMIQFQGNFYIHGWPYYDDGTPVSSSYSGGCIRLSDEDAEKVWALTEKNMPVLVYEEDFAPDTFTYSIIAPEITADAFLVADLRNNFVLLADSEHATFPTLILPKIMTALVASEYRDIEKEIEAPSSALVPSDVPRLKAGNYYSIYDLLWPLTMEDSAEAAETLASDFGTSEFRGLVRSKLDSVGMSESSVTSASGWKGDSTTSAEDIFKISKYLYNNRPFLLTLASGKGGYAYGTPAFYIRPRYTFSDPAGLVGSIVAGTQKNDAAKNAAAVQLAFAGTSTPSKIPGGRDALAIFEMKFGEVERPVAFILLGSEDPVGDIERMRSYIASRYR